MTQVVIFGNFHFFPRQRLLLDQDKAVPLGSRALEILTALIENAGDVVPKETLIARVWPGITVEEASLRVHISAIRKCLRDGLEDGRSISNIPGRGYSFVAPAEIREGSPPNSESSGPAPASLATLPQQLIRIVGREEILRSLIEQLPRRRFLTITGPGGIGKTTVALAVAKAIGSHYGDGVIFLDLSPVRDPSFVAGKLAAALGIALDPNDPVSLLVSALREKQMLILLDSCEHVIDAAADLATGLLRYTDQISILATSREALRAEGEWVQRIPALAVPQPLHVLTAQEALQFPAVQLFVERAADSLGGYSLSDAEAPLVAEICRKLDGIALAIELAAGRTNTISVRDLTAQIDDRFRVLTRGRRTAFLRHQTLRATLDWSYDRLPKPEQLLLNRLSIFNGSFTLAVACAVCSGDELAEADVPDGIASLVAKSLVAANLCNAEASYRLLDTTRSYAREKLEASDEYAIFAERHARHICAVLEAAAVQLEERSPTEWLASYVPQIENLRATLNWAFSSAGDPALGVALTIAAVPLWSQLSLADESREWVERALSVSPALSSQDRRSEMQLHAALGGLQMYAISSVRQSNNAWETALEIAAELGDGDYQLRAIRALWAEAINSGEFQRALSLAERFRELALQKGSVADQVVSDRLVGTALHFLGKQEEADAVTERMLSRYAASSARSHVVRYQFNQNVSARIVRERILWMRGRTESALRDIKENVSEALALDHTMSLCNVLTQAACPIALLAGEFGTAERYIDLLRDRTEPRALDIWYAYAICFGAELEIERGNVEIGLSRLQSTMEELLRSGFGHYRTSFLMARARGFLALNQGADADATIAEAMSICERTGERWCLPEMYRLKGEITLHQRGRRGIDPAVTAFHEALKLAREQQALAWELRAATGLARCLSEDRRIDDARTILSQILAQFAEGHDRPELAAAATLLEHAVRT
jgi:predicted ATPase/DNA-binding winged helix-turn-helix (wHTH) protein